MSRLKKISLGLMLLGAVGILATIAYMEFAFWRGDDVTSPVKVTVVTKATEATSAVEDKVTTAIAAIEKKLDALSKTVNPTPAPKSTEPVVVKTTEPIAVLLVLDKNAPKLAGVDMAHPAPVDKSFARPR